MKKTIRLLAAIIALLMLAACAPQASVPDASPDQAEATPIPAPQAPEGTKWDEEVNLLVIGGGVAGLTSAIEAADNGLDKILVVEKLAVTGGSAFVSEGILGGWETRVTKALGLHVDPADMFADQMREKEYNLDPALTWLTTLKSGETIDWLIDDLGMAFKPEVITKPGYGSFRVIHIVEGGGPGMRAPYEAALAARPQIEVRTETKGVELITEGGAVIGAVVEAGGATKRIGAKAVVLATGGYNSNRELIAAVHPANAVFQSSLMPGSTGDGLLMATAAGAGANNLDQIQCYLREYNNPVGQTPYMYTIYVGREGKRFMDEKRIPQTYNQANRDAVIRQYGKDGWDYFWAINDQAAMDAFGLQTADYPGLVSADTLDELAKKIGVDAEGLKATVSAWNEMAANEKDAEFGRVGMWNRIETGPFYALQTTFFSSVCHGGITKNDRSEVTRFDGSAIPGLYAAGEVTATTNSNGYTISAAITWGRVAAQSAAEYIGGGAPEKLYNAGTYTASAKGMKGDVTVGVTFSDTQITRVEVTSQRETYGIGCGLPTAPVEVVPRQIVQEQTLAVDAITGATITRAAILSAVADAVAQAGGDAEALKAERPVEKSADETAEVDVVVVGAGVAGLAAGIEAAKTGAKVLIVEKQGVTGGATARSGGKLLAAGTKWQEAQGIKDTAKQMFDYLAGVGGDLLDLEKVKSFCESAYEEMLWLEEMGVKVQNVEPIHTSLSPWRVHNTLGGGGMTDGHGGQITVPMTEEYAALGGGIAYETAATRLLTDASGKVVGLEAARRDGSVLTVNAKNVVLATGGYAQNREMMARYPAAGSYGTSVPAGNVGDGLVMASAVGADVFDAPATQIVYVSFTCGVGINEEAGLIVNNKGARVANEYTYQYHVGDQMAQTESNLGYYIACANDPNPTVQYGLTLDSTPKADSIEALAALIEVDPAALKATVDRYNELCAKGKDDDFGKPAEKMIALNGPTYAAIKLNPAVTVTYGGLVTDLSSRVLRPDGTAVNGLYAAGEVAFTGLFGTEYPCCGMAIGSALHFGRIAGQEAAK